MTLSSNRRRQIGRSVGTLLAAAALSLSGISAAPADAAYAFKYGSTLHNGIYHGYAYLTKSGYKIRAVQFCEVNQNEYHQYGKWVKKGKTSHTAGCPVGRFLGSSVSVKHL